MLLDQVLGSYFNLLHFLFNIEGCKLHDCLCRHFTRLAVHVTCLESQGALLKKTLKSKNNMVFYLVSMFCRIDVTY
jgi:hypothetical protein